MMWHGGLQKGVCAEWQPANMRDNPVGVFDTLRLRRLDRCCWLLLQGAAVLSPGTAHSGGRALSRKGSAMGEFAADPRVWGRSRRGIWGNSRSSFYYEATSSLEAFEVGFEAAVPGRCTRQAASALGICMQHPTSNLQICRNVTQQNDAMLPGVQLPVARLLFCFCKQ